LDEENMNIYTIAGMLVGSILGNALFYAYKYWKLKKEEKKQNAFWYKYYSKKY
jgi:hypothetical protein